MSRVACRWCGKPPSRYRQNPIDVEGMHATCALEWARMTRAELEAPGRRYSCAQLARVVGRSRERIRQLEVRALLVVRSLEASS